MSRWLLTCEIEGHLGVNPAHQRVSFRHPSGAYEVDLENVNMQPGCETPLLKMYLAFDGPSMPTNADLAVARTALDSAEPLGEKHAKRFIDFLGFCTGARFRIKQKLSLFDWTSGATQHHGYQYGSFADPNVPQLLLTPDLSSTLEAVLFSDDVPEIAQAIHWYALGVAAGPQDEQFELFWFAIETLARFLKNPEKVPDRCAKCREPLWCGKCNEVTVHRPYPSQTIHALFAKHLGSDAERAYRATSDMRNALVHADDTTRVEAEHGFTLAELVDVLGRVAWAVLATAVGNRAAQRLQTSVHLHVVQPTTFLHYRMAGKGHVALELIDGRDPTFADLPKWEAELVVTDAEQRDKAEPPPDSHSG